jgi:hypothetical protein
MRPIRLLVATILLAASTVWWQASKPTIEQTTRPLALKEARQKCPIALPEGAMNIQFAYYSDATVHQSLVRFEVAFEIGVFHVDEVFREHARRMGWSFKSPAGRAITEAPSLSLTPMPQLHVGWFDVEKIHHGKTYGELNSWQPQVWIDEDRNVFFFCLTD